MPRGEYNNTHCQHKTLLLLKIKAGLAPRFFSFVIFPKKDSD